MDNENANRFWIPVWFCPLTERMFSPVVPPTLTPYPDHFIHPLENYPFHRTTQSPPRLCKHVVLTLEVILVDAQVHHSLLYMPPNNASPITSPNPPHEPTIHGTLHFQSIPGDGPHSYSIHSRGSKYRYGFIPFKFTHKSSRRSSERRLSNCTNSGSNGDTCSLSELISSSDQEDPTVDPLLNDHDVVPIDGTLH